MIGTAIIVGPDGAIGGVDEYAVGSLMISVGLSLLAFGTWKARTNHAAERHRALLALNNAIITNLTEETLFRSRMKKLGIKRKP